MEPLEFKTSTFSKEISAPGIEEKSPPPTEKEEAKNPVILHWTIRFKNYITVEPVLCCFLLSTIISLLAIQQLYLEKACRVSLKYPDDICTAVVTKNGSNLTEYETDIQQVVAILTAWQIPLSVFLPAVLVLFAGSWSDRTGRRKACMLIPMIGECFGYLGFLVSAYWMDSITLEVTAIVQIIYICLSGGMGVLAVGMFSFIGDVIPEEERTVRIGIITGVAIFCELVASAINGLLYTTIGYFGVFTLAIVIQIIGIMYGYFCLEDPKRNDVPRIKNFFADFFDPVNVIETIKVVFKKRENYGRLIILLLLSVNIFATAPMTGEGTLLYYYTRLKFDWTPTDFNLFCTYSTVMSLIGTAVVMCIFSKYFGMTDPLMGILACCASVITSTWCGFVQTASLFYWGPAIGIFSSTKGIAIASIQTKLVPAIDRGKVQSVFGVVESLVVTAVVPLYNLVFNATIKTTPETFYFISIGFSVVAILFFMWIYNLQNRLEGRVKKDNLEGEANDNFDTKE